METWIYAPAARLDELRDKVSKLGKKAKKVGAPEPTVLFGTPFEETQTWAYCNTCVKGLKHTTRWVSPYDDVSSWAECPDCGDRVGSICVPAMAVPVVVVIEDPTIDGYEVLGSVDWLTEGAIVNWGIKNVPDFDPRRKTCDHCNKNRARKQTVIIREIATGTVKVIGKECIKAFLGANVAAMLAAIGDNLRDCERLDGFCRGEYAETVYELTLAAYALMAVDSKGAYIRGVTGTDAKDWVFHNYFAAEQRKRDGKPTPKVTDELKEKAFWACIWGAGLTGSSDYERNLSVICRMGEADIKHAALAASLAGAFNAACGRMAESVVKAPKLEGFLGKEKERLTLAVTVIAAIGLGVDDWGNCKTLFRLATDEGQLVTSFSSGDTGLAVGDRARVKGTVKKHDTYKGQEQTVVSRLAVVEIIGNVALDSQPQNG